MRDFLLRNQRLLSALPTDSSAGLAQAAACSARLQGTPTFFLACIQAGMALALREVRFKELELYRVIESVYSVKYCILYLDLCQGR